MNITDSPLPNPNSQLDFLLQVLQAIYDSGGNPQVVQHLLLQINLELLDDNFATVLQDWTTVALERLEREQVIHLAVCVLIFSDQIWEFSLGNRATNLEIAITGYNFVTKVFTREAFPEDWATIQSKLGFTYFDRIQGESAENLETAIRCFIAAREIHSHQTFPQEWQAYLKLIAEMLSSYGGEESPILNKNRNLINAGLVGAMLYLAEVFEEELGNPDGASYLRFFATQIDVAIDICLRTKIPKDYCYFLLEVLPASSKIDNDQQKVYPILQANLNQLDDNFIQLLRSWGQVTLSNLQPTKAQSLAARISNFSSIIAQFPLGNRAVNLEVAIAGYEISAIVYNRATFPQDWALDRHHLGNVYCDRIRGERSENLERAIAYYEDALQVRTREALPKDWADTQANLALAYWKRIQGESAENLERAIACYENALQVRTREALPEYWAGTQNALGVAYHDRILGERAENLECAIVCYKNALQVHTREVLPEDWASTQNNLGEAYRVRILGERAENLECAIVCYENALQVRTREALSEDWASTQENLGIAYWERIRGERSENLERAITCLENALQVRTREAFPTNWAKTQNNLGLVYRDRIQGERAKNLTGAICCFFAALEVRTCQAFPEQWANTQNNLAAAYSYRYIQSKSPEDIEAAIRCYLAALEVRTRQAFPEQWADTQTNLGTAYLLRQEESAKDVETAIRCFLAVLELRNRKFFSQTYLQAQVKLTIAYQYTRQFLKAYDSCKNAIDTVESLRAEIMSGSDRQEDKQKLAEEWNELYGHMMNVCLELGYYDQVIEYAERSKTRNLVELILSRDLKTIFPSEVVSQLEQLRDEIAIGQYQLQNTTVDNPVALVQHLQQLRQQRNELQDCYLPTASGFKFKQFQEILDDRTAVVQFYITSDRLFTFIFTRQTQQPIVLSSKPKDLKKFANWIKGYLRAYNYHKSYWQNRLTTRLHLLAKILHIDEIMKQIPKECDKLILIPHRFLHLLPLHALPVNIQYGESKSQILMDCFLQGVRYIPSCQLLQISQTRQRSEFTNLFAVQNPTGDLTYTNVEVEAIQTYFQTTHILKEGKATREVINKVSFSTNTHCVHFSCHGYFNLAQPRKSTLILANAFLNPAPTKPDLENYFSLQDGEVLDLEKCLTLDTIFTLKLEQCRLVTMSACETGLIDFRNTSDEYIGLPSGFLYAGSPSVVSSLWTVSDLSTAFLMAKFYENLQNQTPVAISLNQAQLWLKDITGSELWQWIQEKHLPLSPTQKIYFRKIPANDKPFQDPFHWAAFCAIGES